MPNGVARHISKSSYAAKTKVPVEPLLIHSNGGDRPPGAGVRRVAQREREKGPPRSPGSGASGSVAKLRTHRAMSPEVPIATVCSRAGPFDQASEKRTWEAGALHRLRAGY